MRGYLHFSGILDVGFILGIGMLFSKAKFDVGYLRLATRWNGYMLKSFIASTKDQAAESSAILLSISGTCLN